jgi:uncharacterized protein YjiS (DUF1127 family)
MNKVVPYPTDAADSVATAIASVLLSVGSIVKAGLLRQAELHRGRRARRELDQLSDHLLRDIGLSRHDVARHMSADFPGSW